VLAHLTPNEIPWLVLVAAFALGVGVGVGAAWRLRRGAGEDDRRPPRD
jgi:hypothetical protein